MKKCREWIEHEGLSRPRSDLDPEHQSEHGLLLVPEH